mmetsp:Transcript_33988/g.91102  ORF Transcript_33988/g.91102 Transcript_33988/m.91102 type:complete len:235 (-) Transcript_33988:47-751(-)
MAILLVQFCTGHGSCHSALSDRHDGPSLYSTHFERRCCSLSAAAGSGFSCKQSPVAMCTGIDELPGLLRRWNVGGSVCGELRNIPPGHPGPLQLLRRGQQLGLQLGREHHLLHVSALRPRLRRLLHLRRHRRGGLRLALPLPPRDRARAPGGHRRLLPGPLPRPEVGGPRLLRPPPGALRRGHRRRGLRGYLGRLRRLVDQRLRLFSSSAPSLGAFCSVRRSQYSPKPFFFPYP